MGFGRPPQTAVSPPSTSTPPHTFISSTPSPTQPQSAFVGTSVPTATPILNDAWTLHSTNIRQGPGYDYDIDGRLPPHTVVSLVTRSEDGLWVHVEVNGRRQGWVTSKALQLNPAITIANLSVSPNITPSKHTLFATFDAIVRQESTTHAAPGLDQPILATHIPVGATLHLIGRDTIGQWVLASDDFGVVGWLLVSNLTLTPGLHLAHLPDMTQAEPAHPPFALGRQTHDLRHPDLMHNIGMTWMNIDFEWPTGQIDPERYVQLMLAPAYTAVKETNPNILVISGASAPTGFDNGVNTWADAWYITVMIKAGAANFADCIGVHYNAGATSPYATSGHPAGDFYGWYFQPSMAMVYEAYGKQKPLCITELGFLTGDGYDRLPDRFWWAQQTHLEQQGQ